MATQTDTTAPGKNLDGPYLDRLKSVEVRPVFIVGPHRSGTTLLHRILAETGKFNVVTVHHILNRHRLLHLYFNGQDQAAREELAREFESKGIRAESMNSREFTPDAIEEYCYALEPQRRKPRLAPENAENFKIFCKKLQVVQDPSRPLLLKNPFDGVGFLYIREVFPQARFIFIYRNPVDIISSKIRLNRLLLSRKFEYHAAIIDSYRQLFEKPLKLATARFLFSERLPVMRTLVVRDVSENCDYMLANSGKFGAHGMGISYPELCNEPTSVIRHILDFAGIAADGLPDYSNMIRKREPDILPEVERARERILKRNEAFCRTFHV